MKTISIIIAVGIALSSCGTCIKQAVLQAEDFSKTYETRIAVYKILEEGSTVTMGFDQHAQVQVKRDNKWMWVDSATGAIQDEQEMAMIKGAYEVGGKKYDYLYWPVDEFKAWVTSQGVDYNKAQVKWQMLLLLIIL